jgi:hypothetical protein
MPFLVLSGIWPYIIGRKFMKYFAIALIGLAIPFAVTAQDKPMAQNDRFAGTWKLNVAKSKFNPGPLPTSITVTIAPDKVSVEEVLADGKTQNWSYTPSSGSTVNITGMENSSVMEKRVNDRMIEHSWRMGTSILQGRGILSKDGKRMTYTLTGTTEDGKSLHNIEVYENQ